MWWIKKHLAHPLLPCEQALLLRESREITRDPHAKGDASARGSLASRFARAFSRLSPSFWRKTTGPTVLSHDTKPCRRTSAWEAIRTDAISKSILLRPRPGLFKRWIALSAG